MSEAFSQRTLNSQLNEIQAVETRSWTIGFAVTTPRPLDTRLYYQSPLGAVSESRHDGSQWTQGIDHPVLCNAAPGTPLATLSWNNGEEVRVYYISTKYRLEDVCYSKGKWSRGELNKMNFFVARNSSIAALKFYWPGNYTNNIRIYYQEDGSDRIRELCGIDDTHSWSRGSNLPHALAGTSIATITDEIQGLRLRVYYQAPDLSIREHFWHESTSWVPGKIISGTAPIRAQLGALLKTSSAPVPHVYWVDEDRFITHRVNVDGEWRNPQGNSKVAGPLKSGARFAVVEWGDGKHIRVYYQSADHSIVEACQDNGEDWVSGIIMDLDV